MKYFISFALVLLFSNCLSAQQPLVNLKLVISDDSGAGRDLYFGLDPSATDNIDASLGESALPPLPPSGIFDARFNLNQESSWNDYRNGDNNFRGEKVHEIYFQTANGKTITISWDLPNGVTGKLQDIITGTIINIPIAGKNQFIVQTPGIINKLKMTINYDLIQSSDEDFQLDTGFVLYQNYPNPFNPETIIEYQLPIACHVTLKLYDILGRETATLVDEFKEAGIYKVQLSTFNNKLTSGVYLYELSAPNYHSVKKLILMK